MIPPFEARSYDFQDYVHAQNIIGGVLCDGTGANTSLEIVNPRWGKTISKVTMSSAEDVAKAVQAGWTAFQEWRMWPIRERAQVLYRLRELMVKNLDELSWLVSHENGKIFSEAQAEVLKGIECVEYGCSLPNIASGNELEVSRGVTCEIAYAPLGVVAGVVPFNFPNMVPLWMLPQALVAGNAFVLKPSERVPLSALRLGALLFEAGLPDGVFNIVHGDQEAVGALADHPRISALAFVGSTRVARLVYARATASGKRALCLGGAKNHLIVVPDADLDLTAENVVASFTGCAGQRCMAASVMLAVGDVDPIIEAICDRAMRMETGRDMGPITNAASVKRIQNYIDDAEKAGAKVLVDGRGAKGTEPGFWIGPTILDHMKPEMPATREEIFGPVLSIVRVPNLDTAIEIENTNPYGNAASIYTTSGDIARRVMQQAEAGMCGVNIGVPVPREPFGFGGWNDSKFGHGNITGWDGYRFWTRQRKISSKWALQKDQTWMS